MYKGYYTIHPEAEGQRPFRGVARMCTADFFAMFDTPFRYGSGWTHEADEVPEMVAVLGEEMNQRLFGGENSVGRTVRIEDREFRVVGVLEHWRPMPKFYDTHNGPFGEAEDIFLPLRFGIETEMYSWGNTNCWKPTEDTYEGFIQSECTWIQLWTQLDTAEQRQQYHAFLDAYAAEQRALGRFQRPTNNKLRDVMAWLRYEEVVPPEARALLINALLFLLVCSVNLIGILLGKFLGRAPEIGVRRALGASRRWVFSQHLIECGLIGVLGCLLGLALTTGSLRLLDRLFNDAFEFQLDLNMFLVALALALTAAMIAGVYPAWRICRVQPGVYLKTQ
jgi:putative ABC transport system permease protein